MNLTTDHNTGLKETTAKGVTLVDFWAEWCGPCRMQGQILHDLEDKLPPGVRILKVNVDEQPELAAEFGVQSIPTLVLMKDGAPLRRWVGVQTGSALLAAIQQAV